ncbi:hypothetical protein TIFTF001_044329 [Ficus carica]|uniref:Putative plant transposon protein domain-containing protein n=1 Tax=Ficus carica TaxID=3494 RepID=A0AA87ZMC8_FICCA|nr:hypothetical protein TIFTF001_044329 [Ficus carica]
MYCSSPKDGSVTFVRDFYANAKEHQNYKTKVREIVVKFDEAIINRHLGLVTSEEDDLANYTKETNIQQVLDTICFKRTQWNISNGVLASFDSKYLEKNMKVWFNFINARLYLTVHVSSRMNVEAIINATTLHAANINNIALSFPSLLSALFEKA